ncbi:flagellar basal body rod protein FlgB [Desertibacillus haloalkaliphilus]|uniref:flagellar basal body rod protein FlgB n=1 Tax=Desertibacillus haloalkaliphilus TaxID=1328930 RepID=UPI001C273334|nr:flagellar basal body rod protein FlgB [Desertibacillus haloalkaliphilus]MBU8907018.1 flagellar basal body rod protein FlgB [Desertibacillus haloalkaliphilus]
MDLFSGSTMRVLEQGLNGSALRQQAISQNIANVDTPNYKAKKVSFKQALDQASEQQNFIAQRTDERHVSFKREQSRGPIVTTSRDTMYNSNGNNVDIDHEMAELSKNQIYYNALIERVNGRFNSLKTVLGGGR